MNNWTFKQLEDSHELDLIIMKQLCGESDISSLA